MLNKHKATAAAVTMLNDVQNLVPIEDDPDPTSSYMNMVSILRERSLIAQDWKSSDDELKKQQTSLHGSTESRLPSKHFLQTKSFPALDSLAATFAKHIADRHGLDAAIRSFNDEVEKGTQFIENVKRATSGVKTSMTTHEKQVKQRRDKEVKAAGKVRVPSPGPKAVSSKTGGGILNLNLDAADEVHTIALTAEEASALDHADQVLQTVGWDAPWIMVDCPEVKTLITAKDKQFNMNLIVFKAGYEKNDRYKKRGATDARISNLPHVTTVLGSYFPPPSMLLPLEKLPAEHQPMAQKWQQVVLHASSPHYAAVSTEDLQLATYRATLQSQKFVITVPFKEVSDYMLDKQHVTAPVHLKAVADFVELNLTQDMLNDMLAKGIHMRKAVVDEGALMFIPMGSIVAEKCLGKKARLASPCWCDWNISIRNFALSDKGARCSCPSRLC